MLVSGQGEEVYDDYRKEISSRRKILNILGQGMKKAKLGIVEPIILRVALFLQVSFAEGHQLIGDFDEELILNLEGGDEIETIEVVDISGSANIGDQGVGGYEYDILPRICYRVNKSSRA